MAAIEVEDLEKRYGDTHALAGVSFSVGEGEVFALLGPNGAGKTTATEILEGYRSRTAGTVRVLGRDPELGERSLHERVGIVLQSCGVQEELTVRELLTMVGSYYPRRRDVRELLELVELDAKEDARVRTLSGGQRRRLDLALALVGDPDVVFLDEPTTGFDPSARRQAWTTLRNLCTLGKTVFLTTHFMDEAEALADRIAVLRHGRIVAAGTPDALGGRDVLPTEIRFSLPPGVEAPRLDGATVSQRGRTVLVVSADGVRATHEVTSWALAGGIALEGFGVSRPTLEDVYLQLTKSDSIEEAA
jgi:ABC-2 type transport system ATP-binding protein